MHICSPCTKRTINTGNLLWWWRWWWWFTITWNYAKIPAARVGFRIDRICKLIANGTLQRLYFN